MKDDRLIAMRVFAAVVETGGFTHAAHVMGVSQPFVSQTIQRLEERLGQRLLDRSTRSFAVTAEGARYLEGARAAIAAVEAAEAELEIDQDRLSGVLRVTAPVAFGIDRLGPALPAFLDAHPALEVELLLTDDRVDLIGERIDVAIRMGRLPDSTLISRKLCDLRRIVVAAPALVSRHGRPEGPRDLVGYPVLGWVGAHEGLNRWHFEVDGKPWTFHAQGRFRSNDGLSLVDMCRAGLGAMRCAEHMARPLIRAGELEELLPGHGPADDGAFYVVTLPQRRAPRLRALVDHLTATFRDPDW